MRDTLWYKLWLSVLVGMVFTQSVFAPPVEPSFGFKAKLAAYLAAKANMVQMPDQFGRTLRMQGALYDDGGNPAIAVFGMVDALLQQRRFAMVFDADGALVNSAFNQALVSNSEVTEPYHVFPYSTVPADQMYHLLSYDGSQLSGVNETSKVMIANDGAVSVLDTGAENVSAATVDEYGNLFLAVADYSTESESTFTLVTVYTDSVPDVSTPTTTLDLTNTSFDEFSKWKTAIEEGATSGDIVALQEGAEYNFAGGTIVLPAGVHLVGLGTGAIIKNGHIDASAGGSVVKNITFTRDEAPVLPQTSHAGVSDVSSAEVKTTMRMGLKNRERSIVADSHVECMSATDEGWKYDSSLSSSSGRKANFHCFLNSIPYSDYNDNTNDSNLTTFLSDYEAWNVDDIKNRSGSGTAFVKVKLHSGSSSVPFVQVYTHPHDDNDDRQSWYRSRITYYASSTGGNWVDKDGNSHATQSWSDAQSNGTWVVLYLGARPTSIDFPGAFGENDVFVPLISSPSSTELRKNIATSLTDDEKIEEAEKDVIKQITIQHGSNAAIAYTVGAAGYKFVDYVNTHYDSVMEGQVDTVRINHVILQKSNPDADYLLAGPDVIVQDCTFKVKNADPKAQYACAGINTVYGGYNGLRVDSCSFEGLNDAEDDSNGGVGIVLNRVLYDVDNNKPPHITNCTFKNLGSGIMCDAVATNVQYPVLISGCSFTVDTDVTLENIGMGYVKDIQDPVFVHIEDYTSEGTITNHTATAGSETTAEYENANLAVLNKLGNEINLYNEYAYISANSDIQEKIGMIGKSDWAVSGGLKDVARFISNHNLDSGLEQSAVDAVVAANLSSFSGSGLPWVTAIVGTGTDQKQLVAGTYQRDPSGNPSSFDGIFFQYSDGTLYTLDVTDGGSKAVSNLRILGEPVYEDNLSFLAVPIAATIDGVDTFAFALIYNSSTSLEAPDASDYPLISADATATVDAAAPSHPLTFVFAGTCANHTKLWVHVASFGEGYRPNTEFAESSPGQSDGGTLEIDLSADMTEVQCDDLLVDEDGNIWVVGHGKQDGKSQVIVAKVHSSGELIRVFGETIIT